MTSKSHGKPYANWVLPGAACSYAIGADGKSSVDEAVLKAIWIRLTDVLAWLFPDQKREAVLSMLSFKLAYTLSKALCSRVLKASKSSSLCNTYIV